MLRFWLVRQSRIPFSSQTLLFFSLFVGLTRGILEHILFGIEARATDVLAFVPFYLSLPFLYGFFLSLIPGLTYQKILQPVTFATLLGLAPPLLDFILTTQTTHSVFYGYFITNELTEFPWLGYNPQRNYPAGEAITIWLTFFLAAFYTWQVTSSLLKTVLALLASYAVYLTYALFIPATAMLILFGELPSSADLASKAFVEKRQIVFVIALVQIFLPWFLDAYHSRALLRYALRLLHLAPFLATTILGTLHASANVRDSLMAALVTLTSGLVVTAHNDFQYGLALNHPYYRHGMLANFFAVSSYLMILFSGYKFALLGIACFALSVLYHYPFYKARNTAFGAMKIEGFWGMFSYLTGAMAGSIAWPNHKIISFAFLFFGGFSLFSLVKDAKDIHPDYQEKRITIYTFLYQKEIKLSTFHKIFSTALFLLILIPGLLYYSDILSLGIHCLLAMLTGYTALKAVHKISFYAFLTSIVAHLVWLMLRGG